MSILHAKFFATAEWTVRSAKNSLWSFYAAKMGYRAYLFLHSIESPSTGRERFSQTDLRVPRFFAGGKIVTTFRGMIINQIFCGSNSCEVSIISELSGSRRGPFIQRSTAIDQSWLPIGCDIIKSAGARRRYYGSRGIVHQPEWETSQGWDKIRVISTHGKNATNLTRRWEIATTFLPRDKPDSSSRRDQVPQQQQQQVT